MTFDTTGHQTQQFVPKSMEEKNCRQTGKRNSYVKERRKQENTALK